LRKGDRKVEFSEKRDWDGYGDVVCDEGSWWEKGLGRKRCGSSLNATDVSFRRFRVLNGTIELD
jgi:hypothetical protein